MAITLDRLCKYAQENYGMTLICGEQNMMNLVSWIHMLEDPQTATFLHGHELIFSTGIGHDNTDWLLDFAKGLVENNASGLVLNIGPYIKSIPSDLIDYCNDIQFPLLKIPWKTRIIDISNDFCRKIIKSEENEVSITSAFRNSIFSPGQSKESKSVLERKEFDLNADFCIVALSIKISDIDKLPLFDKLIRMHLTKLLYKHSDRFNLFRQDKHLVAVLQGFPERVVENILKQLDVECDYGGGSYKIHSGISSSESGIKSLPKSYRRAVSLLRLAERQQKKLLSYRSVGIHQLLIEVGDGKVLTGYYKEALSALENYDETYQTDYLSTLKTYIENNASVQEVAKATYVHRNTINYKLKKIKEILKSDLDYNDCLQILLAFKIKELL